jgi:16S rRNA (guanine966-N2)-methyltransferase
LRVIAGEAHGRRLIAPRGLNTRPATARVRASIFSRIAARREIEGARVLDVFAGSGSLGLEALSRGAAAAVFIDSARAAAAAIARNLAEMELAHRGRVLAADFRRAMAAVAAGGECFDLIFIDAPYTNDSSGEALALAAKLDLIADGGLTAVRQYHRAPPLEAAGFECVNVATLGDHRIALYRRPPQQAPK